MNSTNTWRRLPGITAVLATSLVVASTLAQTPASTTADAGADAAPSTSTSVPAAPLDPRVAQIRSLISGTLDIEVEPQSLFEVPLSNEPAIQVEAVRIRALLKAAEEAAQPPAPPTSKPRSKPVPSAVRDAGTPDAETADAGTLRDEIQALDPTLWNGRLKLDSARLEFYSLNAASRSQLLKDHADRKEAAKPRETEAERRAREAEAERLRALEAARQARTEAERLVGEELARLIALESAVTTVRDGFVQSRTALTSRRDAILGWQRRSRDAKAATPEEVDSTYDAIRRALLGSREELSGALDEVHSDASLVPSLGPDALSEIPPDVPAEHVRERRSAVGRTIAEARKDERLLREDRTSALFDEIGSLNRERLSLLPYLSGDRRSAVTGFTSAGWDQAGSEAWHLSLVLRYHQHIARSWVTSLRTGGPSGVSPWTAALVTIPWLLLSIAFVWGRRRTPALLKLAAERAAEADLAEHNTTPSISRRTIRFLEKIHRPLEWVLFFTATMWLLPTSAKSLLEVQLLSSVVGWVLGGALVVNTINALAAGSTAEGVDEQNAVGAIRLRSLQFVGRTVVVFALILVMSTRLVGEGTIYSWVFSTCWFAAIPVFLVLVRWWRTAVFERMDRLRKKSRLQAWILSNREGWKSFLAAMIGAVQLFGSGFVKTVRSWISGFDLTRRILAYLFKRELERLGEAAETVTLKPLPERIREALSPEGEFSKWLPSPSDGALEQIALRASEGRGGIIAVVGPRGMGKSSFLRALHKRVPTAVAITCTDRMSVDDLQAKSKVDAHSALGRNAERSAVVTIDDAHYLLRPVIGGLAKFDKVVAMARARCSKAIWVFAFDASIWPFLKRARDARPLFDETHVLAPWNEVQIGALLADRCALANITPTYDQLLDKLPPGADDLDRLDALTAKQAGYERMLWDHVRGNPALALEAWRSSLGKDAEGVVHVRPLQVPDSTTLDQLPDSSLFILRAVLQLAPAAVDDVAHAARLSQEQVQNAFRFGQTQGFFTESEGRVQVTWPWLRPVLLLLERRHLLVNS